MKTSLIIPFKNEIEYVNLTMSTVYDYLQDKKVDFELIAVDDSTDGTWEVLEQLAKEHTNVIAIKGGQPSGYGKALKSGFEKASGDIIIPFNGDLCDSLEDVSTFIELVSEGYDMVFGSRFMNDAQIVGSKGMKNGVSRIANKVLQIMFWTRCSDLTNSFKAYKRTVLETLNPSADGYHIGMEIALIGIRKGYTYKTIPITWSGRKFGRSKMAVLKVIPRYLKTAWRIRWSNPN